MKGPTFLGRFRRMVWGVGGETFGWCDLLPSPLPTLRIRIGLVVDLFDETRLTLAKVAEPVAVPTGRMGKAEQAARPVELLGRDQHLQPLVGFAQGHDERFRDGGELRSQRAGHISAE
jgi:hypothetical protein